MFSFLTTLLSALSISVIAAYFSIIGLATIFPGAKSSIIIMGIVLEIGKIITILWLHRNWDKTKWLIKSYFVFAVLVLMAITSLGIFGFLSKSHIEHQNSANNELVLIENIETNIIKEEGFLTQYEKNIENLKLNSENSGSKYSNEITREENKIKNLSNKLKEDIKIETDRIDSLNKRKLILDEEMDTLKKSSGGLFSNKKKKIEDLEKSQAQERLDIKSKVQEYNENIESFRGEFNKEYKKSSELIESFRNKDSFSGEENQKSIDLYNDKIRESMDRIQELKIEKTKYGQKIRALEVEIGPLKYFIGFMKDFFGIQLNTDQAVTIMVLIIMSVFDPLAVLLVVAAQITFMRMKDPLKTYRLLSDRIKEFLRDKAHRKTIKNISEARKKNEKIISKPPSITIKREAPKAVKHEEESFVQKINVKLPKKGN